MALDREGRDRILHEPPVCTCYFPCFHTRCFQVMSGVLWHLSNGCNNLLRLHSAIHWQLGLNVPVLKTIMPLPRSVGTGKMLELIISRLFLEKTTYWPDLGLILKRHVTWQDLLGKQKNTVGKVRWRNLTKLDTPLYNQITLPNEWQTHKKCLITQQLLPIGESSDLVL